MKSAWMTRIGYGYRAVFRAPISANRRPRRGAGREEYKKIGVEYAYFRSRRETDWYPHYIHNLDNLIRFGSLYPPIHVHADIRRTVLLGATWVYEGGCMAVRARDPIYRIKDLKGKKIGLSKSLNTIKNDFDVDEWARPGFLEKAAAEVLKAEWERRSWSRLPVGGGLEVEGIRLG